MASYSCGHGQGHHFAHNQSESAFDFANSLDNDESTPNRPKGKKHKKNEEVFSPKRDVNFQCNRRSNM